MTHAVPVEEIQCLAATGDACGEGCVWHPQQNAIFWTDINRGLLHSLSMATHAISSWRFDQPVTSALLTTDPRHLLLVLGGRIVLWDTKAHQETDVLFRLPQWPALRCNDARVDPAGVLWFGTMQNNIRSDGTTSAVTEWCGDLCSLAAGADATTWLSGFGISNTVAWSPDGETMYFGDTLANTIYSGRFDQVRSRLEIHAPFFRGFGRGLPDGSVMDVEGCLWNCRYGGSCIVRIDPHGRVVQILDTRFTNPTTGTFAARDLQTLVITSAENRSADENLAPSLFVTRCGVSGLRTTPFAL